MGFLAIKIVIFHFFKAPSPDVFSIFAHFVVGYGGGMAMYRSEMFFVDAWDLFR